MKPCNISGDNCDTDTEIENLLPWKLMWRFVGFTGRTGDRISLTWRTHYDPLSQTSKLVISSLKIIQSMSCRSHHSLPPTIQLLKGGSELREKVKKLSVSPEERSWRLPVLCWVSRSDFPLLPSDKAGLETRESYINNYQLVSPVPIHQNGASAGISKISNYDYTSHHLLLNTIFSWKSSKYKCFKHSKSFNILIQSYYSRPEW